MTWRLDHHVVAELQRGPGHGLLPQPKGIDPGRQDTSRRAIALGSAQRLGPGLAAPLGHRLGQVGEQHRQPEPDHDGQLNTDGDSRGVQGDEPTSTTNRLVLICTRGQLLNASGVAFHRISGQQPAADPARFSSGLSLSGPRVVVVTDISAVLLRTVRARKRGAVRPTRMRITPTSADEQRCPGPASRLCGTGARLASDPARPRARSPAQTGRASRCRRTPGARWRGARYERRAVVVGHRGERVHHFGQPVRA